VEGENAISREISRVRKRRKCIGKLEGGGSDEDANAKLLGESLSCIIHIKGIVPIVDAKVVEVKGHLVDWRGKRSETEEKWPVQNLMPLNLRDQHKICASH